MPRKFGIVRTARDADCYAIIDPEYPQIVDVGTRAGLGARFITMTDEDWRQADAHGSNLYDYLWDCEIITDHNRSFRRSDLEYFATAKKRGLDLNLDRVTLPYLEAFAGENWPNLMAYRSSGITVDRVLEVERFFEALPLPYYAPGDLHRVGYPSDFIREFGKGKVTSKDDITGWAAFCFWLCRINTELITDPGEYITRLPLQFLDVPRAFESEGLTWRDAFYLVTPFAKNGSVEKPKTIALDWIPVFKKYGQDGYRAISHHLKEDIAPSTFLTMVEEGIDLDLIDAVLSGSER